VIQTGTILRTVLEETIGDTGETCMAEWWNGQRLTTPWEWKLIFAQAMLMLLARTLAGPATAAAPPVIEPLEQAGQTISLPMGMAVRQTISVESWVGDTIPAVLSMPAGAAPKQGFPACLVLHGSGGLLRENEPGLPCGPQLEGNFEALMQMFESLGVLVLAPNSFARDPLFCEDNDEDYFGFVPPPFHNPGDGSPQRDDAYSARRLETRVLDAGGALRHLQEMPTVDPHRLCVVGTSNGGSVTLVLAANATGRHASQFGNTAVQRPLESASHYLERQLAFANYPPLPVDPEAGFDALPVLKFGHAISPGCFLRRMIPTADPDSVSVLDWPRDFFHPEAARDGYVATELHVDMGSDDGVPDHCRVDGIRHRQASAYQSAFGVSPARWLPVEHPGFGHDLLGDNPAILEKTRALTIRHFFDSIFSDGLESSAEPLASKVNADLMTSAPPVRRARLSSPVRHEEP
jgi:dienelactone hydrolase